MNLQQNKQNTKKMGSLFSQIQRPINVAAGSVTEIITGRKRKREDEEYDSSDEISSAAEQSLNTPKRFVVINLFEMMSL